MYQFISFYRFYIGMIVTVKMSSCWPSSHLKTLRWRQYRLHPFPYILSQSKFTKETGPFSMDQSLFGLVHNYSLKKSLFTSDSLAQLSFKVACFVARGQKYSKFNFSRLSEKNHISIQSGSIWSWIDPVLGGLKYDKILSILNSPVLIFYIIYRYHRKWYFLVCSQSAISFHFPSKKHRIAKMTPPVSV